MKSFCIILSLAAVASAASKDKAAQILRFTVIGTCFGEAADQMFTENERSAIEKCSRMVAADTRSLDTSRTSADAIQKLIVAAQRKAGTTNGAAFGKLWMAVGKFVEGLLEQQAKENLQARIGVCTFQELGLYDAKMEFNLTGMMEMADGLEGWNSQGTKEELKKNARTCVAKIQGMPEVYFKGMLSPPFVKMVMFVKCMADLNTLYCADYFTKLWVERKFGPISKLVDDTGMEEKVLLDVASQLY